MKKQILAVLIFGFVSSFTQAQNLTGKVINALNQPLETVYIYNLNSENHAHTTENGVFVLLNTSIGDSLRIGLLGYKTKSLKLNPSIT